MHKYDGGFENREESPRGQVGELSNSFMGELFSSHNQVHNKIIYLIHAQVYPSEIRGYS